MESQNIRIERIKDILKEIDFLDDMYSKNDELRDYSAPVLKSAIACELILMEILINNGIDVKDGLVNTDDSHSIHGKIPVLSYCARKEVVCIPDQIRNLLEVIRNFRNRAAHDRAISLGEMQEFNKAFDAFKCWFFNEYDVFETCDEKTKVWFTDYLIGMENSVCLQLDETNIEKARIAQLKRIRAYVDAYNKRFSLAVEVVEDKKPELNVAMEEYKKVMLEVVDERTGKILEAIADSTKTLSAKIDNMTTILENLVHQINSYQALVQNQIDLAVTEDEIERIVQAYTNTCVDKIVDEIDSKYSTKTYEAEEEKLRVSLGEAAWNKLSEESQKFLVSAKVTYNYLINIKSAIDYSGVCLLVTKALEVEMKKRFYTDYVAYLKNTYPGRRNYNKFPAALLNQYGQPIRAKDFTLGRVAFTLCAKFGNNATEQEKDHDRDILIEFSKSALFVGKSDEEILDMLESYGEDIADITDEYRNKAAHTNELKRVNAELCFNLVLDVEKLLKRMLDSFAY